LRGFFQRETLFEITGFSHKIIVAETNLFISYYQMNKVSKKVSKQDFVFFAFGCLISLFSFLLIFIIEFSSENFFVNSSLSLTSFLKSTVYCLFVAIIEEFLLRYLFLKKWLKNKHQPFSKKVIYLGLISSLVFGFLHLNLEEFPLFQINSTLAGGGLFYATYKFRNISIAIGMHFFWNFIQGVIFPFQGSGSGLASVFVMENEAMVYPEGSSYIVFAVLLEILLITLLSRVGSFSKPDSYIIYTTQF